MDVCQEGQPAGLADGIDQQLRVFREGGHIPLGADGQDMVLLRLALLVMDLLPHQQQDAPGALPVIALHALHPDIVVGDDDGLQPGLHGGLGDVAVGAAAVRVACVHV